MTLAPSSASVVPARVALVVGPSDAPTRAALVGDAISWAGPLAALPAEVARLEARGGPRWVVWSARQARSVVREGVKLSKLHDVAEAHRLLHGGWAAEPGLAWASAQGVDQSTLPPPPTFDLFAADEGHDLVRSDGHLRADAVYADWLNTDERLHRWANAALEVARLQSSLAPTISARLTSTIYAESAAALLCVELETRGLPIDRQRLEGLIAQAAGPRADDDGKAARAARDAAVLALLPGRERTDLRNPAQVKDALASVGVHVPNTRKWVLEPYRDSSPVVAALLEWRKAERIATTYGYRWLEQQVGPDDRLRGAWTACDGAAGRMTADNGLHNLPAPLRPGVAAAPGWMFVRADLGQIEPRVLAVVSGDAAFAQATMADDLYAPVAKRLGVERPVAKIAVLAAMYGQRSGAAGEALKGLERAYPVAMSHLDRAYAAGVAGRDLRTYGGRLIKTGRFLAGQPIGGNPALDAARGRFARNAVIQGAAAELFKAWAATVRAALTGLGGEIVLCLHDELLVHVPQESATIAAQVVDDALTAAARRWCGAAPVRFVADTSVIKRWSEAK